MNEDLNKEKNTLSKQKKEREEKLKENLRLKQQTGIVENKSLKADYNNREKEVEYMEAHMITLKRYHQRLTQYIERAQQIQSTN